MSERRLEKTSEARTSYLKVVPPPQGGFQGVLRIFSGVLIEI